MPARSHARFHARTTACSTQNTAAAKVCKIFSTECTSGEDETKLKCNTPEDGYEVDVDGHAYYAYKAAPAPQPVTTTPEPTSAVLEHDGEFLKYLHGFFHYGGTNVFDIGNQTYVTAVVGLGGLVIAIGVLMLLVWFLFLCCR